MQVVAPATGAYEPATHGVVTLRPVAPQDEPVVHAWHTVKPVSDEHRPIGQAAGAAVLLAQKNPAGQSVQAVAATKVYWPRSQAVGPFTVATPQNEPAGHGVLQTVAPADGPYMPATQFPHTVVSDKEVNLPALQFTGATVVDAQYDPARQSVHAVADVGEYWPVKHATGAVVVVAQNEPAGQAVHADAPCVKA